MIIQIMGNVRFQITLDPSTWIFDDRKEELDKVLANDADEEQIEFSDSREWSRQIIEGTTKPPTLKSEKKFKKQELLDGTFVICLKPFLEYTEPERGEDAMITFTHDDSTTILPYNQRHKFYAHFSKDGKRLYDDGFIDILVIDGGKIENRLEHVTGISFE
ncbi:MULTISPECIES: hypothetical protein [Salinicoccus]|uniref:hypothetical protein n=1 Tax=Salinicoccus TaxID=45669 RepID=UPI001CA6EBE4|nr:MULTISPECIES: hypothetical protein [Salinicoccus]MBY8909300.1 hypothetical protein [Salinicoccus roseus]MCC4722160.1 hypothetical protein [Salinicoccus sp. RF5]